MAVAEQVYNFEHRDLHWGNVLISKTSLKQISFVLDENAYYVTTYGVKVLQNL